MPGEISIGVTCRDVALLPQDEAGLRAFYDNFMVPAIYEDFMKNFKMITNQGVDATRAYPGELQQRGCEVSGSVSVRF